MKKITLIISILFLSISVFAQKTSVLLTEGFSGGVPPTGWTIDDMASQWSQSTGTKAGGTAPEAKLTYVPGTYTTHLISPEIDLTGLSTVIFSFKHFLNDYSGFDYTIGVATRSGGGSWNVVWTVNPTGDMGPETNDIIISNADVSAFDFQVCLFLTGDWANFNSWYIDDVNLYSPDINDAALQSINTNPYSAAANIDIKCTFNNIGINNITSADINYQIDNGTVNTENINGLNLTTTESQNYTFTTPWTATPGNYNLKVWISNINGNGIDDDQTNDTLNLSMHIATQSVSRSPLYEEFTSSTCGSCATFNSNYFTKNFLSSNDGNYTLIKYQMDSPSLGDPYYTEECGIRKEYYNVSVPPTLFLDAQEGTAYDTGVLQANLDNELTVPTFFTMSADYQISGNNITVNTDIIPYLDAPNFTVQIAVIEETTTGNTGSNGETEFQYVMMKMLPDASGTITNFTSGTPANINESFDMSSTFVEEMNDLAVVVFVQNNATKEVFQSSWALPYPQAEITPADAETNVYLDEHVKISFLSKMLFADGNEITDENISNFIHVSDPSKGNLTYTATINSEKTFIDINPDDNFTPNTDITVTIDDSKVKNENDKLLTGSSVTFTGGTETGINKISDNSIRLYPNPAVDFINYSGVDSGRIIIYDISGKQVLETTALTGKRINISKLSTGIYTMRIISKSKAYNEKFIKNNNK